MIKFFSLVHSFLFFTLVTGFQLPSFSFPNLLKLFKPNQVRIINGRTALFGEFPYQALLKGFRKKDSFICGGSIISEHFVLTAAHCVSELDLVQVKLGITHLMSPREGTVVLITPKDIIVHEDFDSSFMKNDIALIRLRCPLNFTAQLQPIRLPTLSQINADVFDNEIATLSGWGKIHDSDEQAHPTLQTTNVHVMRFWQCEFYLATLYYQLDNNQICTVYFGSGPCSGDSGGGLVIVEPDGVKTIIGIVSFGLTFCESGTPTVYTSVSGHLSWISRHTGIILRE